MAFLQPNSEQLKAKLKRLELDQRKGSLVSSKDVLIKWTNHISSAKVQLLGLTSKIRTTLSAYVHDEGDVRKITEEIDELIKQTLIDLSGEETNNDSGKTSK